MQPAFTFWKSLAAASFCLAWATATAAEPTHAPAEHEPQAHATAETHAADEAHPVEEAHPADTHPAEEVVPAVEPHPTADAHAEAQPAAHAVPHPAEGVHPLVDSHAADSHTPAPPAEHAPTAAVLPREETTHEAPKAPDPLQAWLDPTEIPARPTTSAPSRNPAPRPALERPTSPPPPLDHAPVASNAPAADAHATNAHAADTHADPHAQDTHAAPDAHGATHGREVPIPPGPDELAHSAVPSRSPLPPLLTADGLEQLLLEDEGQAETILRDFVPVSINPEMQLLERSAWVQRTIGQIDKAEEIYLQLLQRTPDRQKPEIYLELANFYTDTDQYLKTIAVYERFVRRYEQDPRVPEIHLRLGMLYRRFENYALAVESFFSVLQLSFNIPEERIDYYRRLSELAQYEIAETYYQKGDYNRAAEFYLRLQRVTDDQRIKAEARLKEAYANLLMGNYPLVIAILREFASDFPESPLVPDSRFLLARAYYMVGNRDLARRQVLSILASDLQPVDDDLWGYWLKTIGNQLANDLYEAGDFSGAHRIYHALLSLSEDPEWRWPIIYQIGVCLERQGQAEKAAEVYAMLLDQTLNLVEGQPNEAVRSRFSELRQRAQTRLDQLQWRADFNRELQQLAPGGLEPLIRPS